MQPDDCLRPDPFTSDGCDIRQGYCGVPRRQLIYRFYNAARPHIRPAVSYCRICDRHHFRLDMRQYIPLADRKPAVHGVPHIISHHIRRLSRRAVRFPDGRYKLRASSRCRSGLGLGHGRLPSGFGYCFLNRYYRSVPDQGCTETLYDRPFITGREMVPHLQVAGTACRLFFTYCIAPSLFTMSSICLSRVLPDQLTMPLATTSAPFALHADFI